jgi:PAS domain S-box-containing protein
VLSTALRQGLALRAAYPDANLVINVNVSMLQLLQPGCSQGVAKALEAVGCPPQALCLEVVESMLADATAASALAEIRGLGVTVAIDDFGVGNSSLSYLRHLPIDKAKLDRSFLENIEGDPNGVRFVTAVIALAHAAGKPVVFEGIETLSQFRVALAAGADMVQGFFFAPPLSANAAAELVVQHRELDARRPPETPPAQGQAGPSDLNAGDGFELRLVLIAREASSARDELAQELARRKATETALRESEERYRLLLHSKVTEALYLLDPEGNIETWNASAERIKGYSSADVVGKNFSMFFTAEDIENGEPARILEKARENGRFSTKGWRVRKGGARFLAFVVIEAIFRDDGTLRGFAKMTLDITDKGTEKS